MNNMKCVDIVYKKYNIYLINVTTFFHYFNGCYQKVLILAGLQPAKTLSSEFWVCVYVAEKF